MKPLMNRSVGLLGLILTNLQPLSSWAENTPNPYQAIIDRNPFNLRPPPPAPEPVVAAPVIPAAKVTLTGLTSLFGRTPRAVLEIIEQEPGKAATPPRKPILKEGERDGAIEVVSIDMENNTVRIRNSGIETNITFVAQQTGGAQLPPALLGNFAAPPQVGVPQSVGGVIPGRAGAAAARNGVTVYGNNGAAAAANNSATGLRSIPSRTVRADSSAQPDQAKQYLDMAIQHQINTGAGKQYPPMLPMPGTAR
jgi:hypothetical protein